MNSWALGSLWTWTRSATCPAGPSPAPAEGPPPLALSTKSRQGSPGHVVDKTRHHTLAECPPIPVRTIDPSNPHSGLAAWSLGPILQGR